MSTDDQGTKCRRKIADIYNSLSKVQERFRQTTDDRQTDGRQHIANMNVTSRSLKKITRWLYCVECPQYSTRLEALAYLYVSSNKCRTG